MDYPLMLSPIKVGNVELKNRIIFSAHLTNMAEDHMPSRKQSYYYMERAKGGAGLIITEETSVHPTDWAYEKLIDAFNPEVVPGYRFMTDRVHRGGAKIFLQLNHNGGQCGSEHSRKPVWGASNITDPLFGETAKAIDEVDIAELIDFYAKSAEYGKLGGFDGIEFQGSHSSILRQFLSPYSNKRTDKYGGSLENRFRIVREIGAAVRQVIGDEMALGIRLSGEEYTDGGLTLDDTVEIAKLVDQCGLFDYINVSVGIATHNLFLVEGPMALPPVFAAYLSAAIKKAVSIPVVAVGRIKDPKQAEQVLAKGMGDLVGVVRGQISDPYFVKKTIEGREEEINGCLSCNQDCIGRVGLNKQIGCVQNTFIGKEEFMSHDNLPQIDKKKKVVVVGGGPGGMEAAITASRRGHDVVLMEKTDALGGAIPLAASLPKRAELADSIRNLNTRIALTDVDIRLNTEATVDSVLAESPDAVIVATGAKVQPHWLKGDNENVYDVREWLENQRPLGDTVAIIDYIGFFQGAATAELLADMGKKVLYLTGSLQAGQGLGKTTDLELWSKRAVQKGVEMITNVSVSSIADGKLNTANNYTGEAVAFAADSVLIANPNQAENSLYYDLKNSKPGLEMYLVGDACAPRRLENAIHEGFLAAIEI